MTTLSLKEKIIGLAKETTDGIDKQLISEKTESTGIVLESALSKLVKEGLLTVQENEGKKIYSLGESIPKKDETESTPIEQKEISGEEKDEKQNTSSPKISKGKNLIEEEEGQGKIKEEKTESSSKKGKSEGGRDMRKFKFMGEQYTKGGLALAVVGEYVAKHKNISLTKLKEVFPDDLIKRFGVFQEVKKAKSFASGGRERYFLKEDQIIKLNGSRIAITNQWTSDNIKPFLTAARKLGFDIR